LIPVETSVVLELFESQPDNAVTRWLSSDEGPVLLSSIAVADLAYGIALLPNGGRKAALQSQYDLTALRFGDKIVPFTFSRKGCSNSTS
jgi:predicted nucleic acid-binding protein